MNGEWAWVLWSVLGGGRGSLASPGSARKACEHLAGPSLVTSTHRNSVHSSHCVTFGRGKIGLGLHGHFHRPTVQTSFKNYVAHLRQQTEGMKASICNKRVPGESIEQLPPSPEASCTCVGQLDVQRISATAACRCTYGAGSFCGTETTRYWRQSGAVLNTMLRHS